MINTKVKASQKENKPETKHRKTDYTYTTLQDAVVG